MTIDPLTLQLRERLVGNRAISVRGALAILIVIPPLAFAAVHDGKHVAQLQASHSSVDCFFFTLVGVSEADSVFVGNPWFAVPRTQFGAKEAYGALLAARLSGQPVLISASGSLSCGYPTAYSVAIK